ncbi:MAG: transposase [Candidatus Aenigmatarchaeota archaeon]
MAHRFKRSKRGRKPKHSIRSYFKLIIVKGAKKASLREAEQDYSKTVCKSRVDHSVIHYWEKRFDKTLIERMVKTVGNRVQQLLGYLFSIVDATDFTLWNKANIAFHLLSRIARATVYPVSVSFGDDACSIKEMIVGGRKELYADSWYDQNKTFRAIIKQGYIPIIKPNKERSKGYWRNKARKFWNPINKLKYHNRGRGESCFGSLINWLGDRLKTSRIDTSITRIGARVIAYLVKIYMRIEILLEIVRHTPKNMYFHPFCKFQYNN